MEVLAIIAIVLVALAAYFVLKADTDPKKLDSHSRLESFSQGDDPYAEEDKRFDDAILKMVGSDIAKQFCTKLVGITHRNKDGTLRERLIPTCKPFEFLDLIWEPKNKYDPNAIAVHKKGGAQLGYLNTHTAEEVATSISKHGTVWLACVKLAIPKAKNRHGCLVICLMEMQKSGLTPGALPSSVA